MASYLTFRSGNWSNTSNNPTSPWYDNGTQSALASVPGAGDIANIFNFQVFCDSGVFIGTNPADQTTIVLGISGTAGQLVINPGVTLTVSGNIFANAGASNIINDGIVFGSGSRLSFGQHNVAGGWVLKGGQFNTYSTSGTSALAPAEISTVQNSTTNACFTLALANEGNCVNFSNMNFFRLGSSTVVAYSVAVQALTSIGAISCILKNCTFDKCGQILFTTKTSGAFLAVSGCTFQNTLKTGQLSTEFFMVVPQSNPEQILNNVFGGLGGINDGVTFSPPGAAVVSGNYFGSDLSHAALTVGSPDKANGLWISNFHRKVSPGTANTFGTSVYNTYFLNDSETQNTSLMTWEAYGGSRYMANCLFELAQSQFNNSVGDGIFPIVDGNLNGVSGTSNNAGSIRIATTGVHSYSVGDVVHIGFVQGAPETNGVWTVSNVPDNLHIDLSGSTYTNTYTGSGNIVRFNTTLNINNCISLPGGMSVVGSKWINFLDQGFAKPIQCSIIHCTWVTQNYTTQSEQGIGFGESQPLHNVGYGWAGELTACSGNLAWCPSTGAPGYFMVRQGNGTNVNPLQDYVLAANSDYNWGYQLYTDVDGNGNSGIYGYVRWTSFQQNGLFSTGTPDLHGMVGNPSVYRQNPLFIDTTRSVVFYDSNKLGNSYSQWSSASVAYNSGDQVSHAVGSYFASGMINYRCLTSHTSSGAAEPGKGAAWRGLWEFSSLYQLRQSIPVNGPANVVDLNNWTFSGFTPTNPLTSTAAHDGTTVGAVPYSNPANPNLYNFSVLLGNFPNSIGINLMGPYSILMRQ